MESSSVGIQRWLCVTHRRREAYNCSRKQFEWTAGLMGLEETEMSMYTIATEETLDQSIQFINERFAAIPLCYVDCSRWDWG